MRDEEAAGRLSRRDFMQAGAAALGGAGWVRGAAGQPAAGVAGMALDVLRAPDLVAAYGGFARGLPVGEIKLHRNGGRWVGADVVVASRLERDGLALTLAAPATPIALVQVRWRLTVPAAVRVLGDAWERSYGDLGWRGMAPETAMPWYFAAWDGRRTDGCGVKTDARALCFWQMDPEGVSLWLNVANGGKGVLLGERELTMARVVTHRGAEGESAMEAVTALCRAMRARPSRPIVPVYGANDWCYSYGSSTAETILRDTEFVVELSPAGGARPFSVIDDGWRNGTKDWPDMGALAGAIKRRTARPGLWLRPLLAPRGTEAGLLLADGRFGARKERASEPAYDPTVPEARERIGAKLREARVWGYELVKHDFTTYDLLGQWGFEMGPLPSLPGWSLADRTKTNAEAIAELYALLRESAGDRMLLEGCNTVGHLGQGVFDVQRTGDDTSGRQWERTRRMGVNTLAFRAPQQGTFYVLDADVVGITEAVPWTLNRQWLEALARSGTATVVSAGPPARGPEQRAALREAFRVAAADGLGARAADWMETTAPEVWRARGAGERRYRWSGPEGASAFLSA